METSDTKPTETAADIQRPPKMPAAVRIVALIAWIYIVIAAVVAARNIWAQAPFLCCASQKSDLLMYMSIVLGWAALPVCMLRAIHLGYFSRFLTPNIIFWTMYFIDSASYLNDETGHGHIPWQPVCDTLLSLLALAAPLVLLSLPASRAWAKALEERKPNARRNDIGCLIYGLLLGFSILVTIEWPNPKEAAAIDQNWRHSMAEQLVERISQNDIARKEGKQWADPSSCSNSVQFVQFLKQEVVQPLEQDIAAKIASVWCIAVNPPDDDRFPIVVTANVDIRELLFPDDEQKPLTLTCPEERAGGTCLGFCKRGAVVALRCGMTISISADKATPREIFGGAIPKPASDTYFLTPAGRVDCGAHNGAP